jgi:hypothetical protein
VPNGKPELQQYSRRSMAFYPNLQEFTGATTSISEVTVSWQWHDGYVPCKG